MYGRHGRRQREQASSLSSDQLERKGRRLGAATDLPDLSPGALPAPAPSRSAEPRARILRLRRVGRDLPPLLPLLPLGDPSRRVDRVARGQLVS